MSGAAGPAGGTGPDGSSPQEKPPRRKSPLTRAAYRVLMKVHIGIYRASNGRLGASAGRNGDGILLLTTTGRRSGRPHTTPVTWVEVGGELLVVATNGGHDPDPDWFVNLESEPEVSVRIRGEVHAATARVAGPAERERLWHEQVERSERHVHFQEQARRRLPLVLLAVGD